MEKRYIVIISFLFLFLLSALLVYAVSFPANGDTNWGTPLRNWALTEHEDDGTHGTGAIDATEIADDAVTAAKIAADAVGASEIAGVTTFSLTSCAIDPASIASGATLLVDLTTTTCTPAINAAGTERAIVMPPEGLHNDLIINGASMNSGNTLRIAIKNIGVGSIDDGANTWSVFIYNPA